VLEASIRAKARYVLAPKTIRCSLPYSGHSVGELAAVAAGDNRLRSQTTLAVYTHATGQARELALEAVDTYLMKLLTAAPLLRSALP
jgi:malonyl CoA-acyl carrier protein transacylase